MKNLDYNSLENLKSYFEGKKMLAVRETVFGEKREITIDSIKIIHEGNKDVIKCNYSSNNGVLSGVMSIDELRNDYELIE